jgi:hypothetical protein
MLYVFLLAVVIGGGVTGSRYQQYRQVVCVEAPKNCKGDTYYKHIDCIKVQDPQGVISMTTLDESENVILLPTSCWTDGKHTTFNSPLLVMQVYFLCLGCLVVLYFIGVCSWWCCSTDAFERDTDHLCAKSMAGILFVIGWVGVLCAWCTVAVFRLHFQKVVCTRYFVNGDQNDPVEYVIVQADVSVNVTTIQHLMASTRHPSILPDSCWSDGAQVSFYDPADIFYYSTLVTVGVWILAILVVLPSRCMQKYRYRRQLKINNVPAVTTQGDQTAYVSIN